MSIETKVGFATVHNIENKDTNPNAAECNDYNSCCYCNIEFSSAATRDKHKLQCQKGPQLAVRIPDVESQKAVETRYKLQCQKGPQLIVKISTREFQDAHIGNDSNQESKQTRKQWLKVRPGSGLIY